MEEDLVSLAFAFTLHVTILPQATIGLVSQISDGRQQFQAIRGGNGNV